MKKTILLFILLVCFVSNINSQTGWYQINSGIPNSNYISSIFFSDLNTGYCCGGDYNGSVFVRKTTNQGMNWNSLNVSGIFAITLHKMFFINNNTGFISGKCTAGADYEGIVARTTNGGINWNTSFASGTRELYGIQLINDSIGFAVGYYITYSNSARVIVKTTDRGISWSPSISYWNNSDEFFDVHFPSIQTGYVVGLNFFN
ncbi:MAG TPA: hypothetical protein VIK14_09070, partial [Ignavibacteria bacterium]